MCRRQSLGRPGAGTRGTRSHHGARPLPSRLPRHRSMPVWALAEASLVELDPLVGTLRQKVSEPAAVTETLGTAAKIIAPCAPTVQPGPP